MDTKKTQTHHWNLPVDLGKLSCRVSMLFLCMHMQGIKTTCVYAQLWQKQSTVNKYPVLCLRNSPYKSLTRQSSVDICHDLVEEKPQSYSTKGSIMCIAFFQKEHVKHIRLIKP